MVTGGLLSPGSFLVGNWKGLIPVPWKEFTEVVELGTRAMINLGCLRHPQ